MQIYTVPINGFEMYYEIHGEGKPLLLLHGFSGSSLGVRETFLDLAKQYQLIIPDLRGHGHSTNPSNEYTFKQSAEDVRELLQHLKISKCNAIGFSGGGITLLHLAAQTDLIDGMSIVSATPYFPEVTLKLIQEHSAIEKTEEDWKEMRRKHFLGDEQIKLIWKHVSELGSNVEDVNFTHEALQKIKNRTLIVQGDRDPIYPLSITIDLYNGLPNALLWIIPNGLHVPINQETMPAFIDYLQSYVFG